MTKKEFNRAKDAFAAWAFLYPGTGAVALRLSEDRECPFVEIYEQHSYDPESDSWDFQEMGSLRTVKDFLNFARRFRKRSLDVTASVMLR